MSGQETMRFIPEPERSPADTENDRGAADIAYREKMVTALTNVVRLANIEWYEALEADERKPSPMTADRLKSAEHNVDERLDALEAERREGPRLKKPKQQHSILQKMKWWS